MSLLYTMKTDYYYSHIFMNYDEQCSLTFASMPRQNNRVPARLIDRLDIRAHVNLLLLTLTSLIEITIE